jgi:sortase (surface protein transpeptidase)
MKKIDLVLATSLIVLGVSLEIQPFIQKQKLNRWLADTLSADEYPFSLEIPQIGYRGLVQKFTPEALKSGPVVWRGYPNKSCCWIAGHRLPNIFWNLPKLKIGDTVVIYLKSGQRYVFVVSDKRVVNAERGFDENIKVGLMLFTCHPPGAFRAKKRILIICRKEEK